MRVRTLSRRLGSAALVASLGLSMAACSSDDGSGGNSSESGSKSGDKPEAGKLGELSADELYPAIMEALQGAETFKVTSKTTSDGAKVTMNGEARYAGGGLDMRADTTGAQEMSMVMLDQIVYIKSASMGMSDLWMKIDLNSGEDSLVGMLAKTMDPDVQFKLLEDPKKLELVGEEKIDGVKTTRYKITVDPEKFMAAMDFPDGMAQFIPEELISEVWLDADSLPRKVAQETESAAAEGVPASTTTMEAFYTDFGGAVDIQAPPEDETTDQIPGL